MIAAVIIGQIGIEVDSGVKSIFFALFIYAVGYNGGPQFFNSINRSTITQVIAAVVMTVTGLFTVLFLAKQFGLGTGLAAGLAAGGLTQSAIIGTAGNAIDMLGLDPAAAKAFKVDIAVGYSVTYIFGTLGPILMVTGFFPLLYKWDLRKAAADLARKLGGGAKELGEGEYLPLERMGSRVYRVAQGAAVAGHGRDFLEDLFDKAFGEWILNNNEDIDFLFTIAKECGVVLLPGNGFDDSHPSARVSLANLAEWQYEAIGKLTRKVLDELYRKFNNQNDHVRTS